MRKPELARRLAKTSRVSKAEAADQLDRVVHQIVSSLRRGRRARLPGLGEFKPGTRWEFRFDAEREGRADDKG
ncbi:MAG: HU family DNA-binding protein [Bryobacterales bacterium]|nr:HU family DNA-binding protein [Bryobacterales bacterium]